MSFTNETDKNTKHAVLYLHITNNDDDLINKYVSQIDNHNNSIKTNNYPNAGFDIFFPNIYIIPPNGKSEFIKMNIICEMHIYDEKKNNWEPTGYYSYPRSSISKTPLLLANNVGIIDSGYRGEIIGAFRNIASSEPWVVDKYSRLLQICAPDLRPIHVELVSFDFFENTTRGAGGFGSTGN